MASPVIRTFHSRHKNLRMVRVPAVRAYNAIGRPQGFEQKSLTYEFTEGRLAVREGQDVLPDGPLDDNGEPTRQDAVSWLRNHGNYNMVGVVGGFVEDGREPDRVPAPDDALDEIGEAIADLDAQRLEEILADEKAGYGREVVVRAAERAIEKVQERVEKAKPKGKTAA